uniref:Uncharacterized protein n=1 Tax=Clastoptera arizonana TaxID=38151 RepID=A0A1B6CL47_9HEMI
MYNQSPNSNRGEVSNRFVGFTPNKTNQQGLRNPLYLSPNSQYLSPRGNRNGRSNSSSFSPDFIPLGYSSPLTGYRNVQNTTNSWNGSQNESWIEDRRNHNRNQVRNTNYHQRKSFGSQMSSPGSSVSSNYSPYNKSDKYRNKGNFNNSNTSISSYCDKSMIDDPWAECEQELNNWIDKNKTETENSDSDESSAGQDSDSNEES